MLSTSVKHFLIFQQKCTQFSFFLKAITVIETKFFYALYSICLLLLLIRQNMMISKIVNGGTFSSTRRDKASRVEFVVYMYIYIHTYSLRSSLRLHFDLKST